MDSIGIATGIAKVFEGFREKPYLCPAGIWTIGYGTTVYPDGRKVQPTDPPITEETASVFMDYEMKRCINSAIRYCPVLMAYQERLGSITDFVYNLGPGRLKASTLRRRINQSDWQAASYELMKWVRGGGRILPGLVARRKVESSFIWKG